VNYEGVDYSFLNIPIVGISANPANPPEPITTGYSDGFPLFNLTVQPGPWRLVLNEDDKKYQHFATRRGNQHLQSGVYVDDIHTYDMSTGQWSQVSTGFTTYKFNHGSSDDPIRESGVRQITHDNVAIHSQNTLVWGNAVIAHKEYNGRGQYFEFVFGIKRKYFLT